MVARTDIDKAVNYVEPDSTQVDGGSVPLEVTVEQDDAGLDENNYYVEGEEDEFEYVDDTVEIPHDVNIAEYMDESELMKLGRDLGEDFDEDEESRAEWMDIAKDGIDLLGFKIEEKTEPFDGACGVTHPLLAQSVVKFQAKAYKELFPAGGPVKTKIMGDPDPQKEQQATRVRNHMNYQTTIEMPEYGPETDRMLFYVGMYGSGYKKNYFDPGEDRIVTEFVKGTDFIINYYATSLQQAERYTHRMYLSGNTILKRQINGMYRRIEIEDEGQVDITEAKEAEDELYGMSQPINVGDVYTVLEMHVNLNLPGYEHPEGLALPYIVTMIKETDTILSIRRNWSEDDPKMKKIIWFTPHDLIPGLGFYGYGYLHLIGGLAKTATSSLRQLIDAGSFANLPAGYKAHGLRVLAPDEPIRPGEWREINAPAGDLDKALKPLPYHEPSATLFNLMQFMVEAGKEFADATDQIVSEASNYGPVGTTMALMENSARLYSAIHKRLHAAQGKELRHIAWLNSQYLPEEYPYLTSAGTEKIFRADYDLSTIDIIPVSDPNMPTESHRIARLNAIMSIAAQAPQEHNMAAIRTDMYAAMGVEKPERYLAQSQQPFSGDPISENAKAMMGSGLKADLQQNHDAHIKVHSDILNNPAYGENPALRASMTAHVQEHLAMKYTAEMLQLIGDPQVAQAVMAGQPLPPEAESVVAIAAANASDSLLSLDIAKEKALAGETTDPIIAVQEREIALREADQTHKHMIEAEKLALEKRKVQIDDENTDLDRKAKMAAIEMQARNNTGN